MQNKSRKDINGETFADRTLKLYITYIVEQMYSEYGLGMNDCDLHDTESKKYAWRTLHKWDKSKETFVINSTNMYIRMLDSKNSNSTNLQFIKAFVNRIASYLSEFCQNAPERSKFSTQKMLVESLYDNNSYVRGLQRYQTERREKSCPRTPELVAEKKKRKRISVEEHKARIERQVKMAFQETMHKNK